MADHERKPGFIYMKSEILKQEIAMSEKTGRVYCEDKVQYAFYFRRTKVKYIAYVTVSDGFSKEINAVSGDEALVKIHECITETYPSLRQFLLSLK